MKVRATQKGYYGGKLREPGEIFSITHVKAFSQEWMEAVGWDPKAPAEPAPPESAPPPALDPAPTAGKPGRPPKASAPAEPAET
jgi:hypothetical protein